MLLKQARRPHRWGRPCSTPILESEQRDDQEIGLQRERIARLKDRLKKIDKPEARDLLSLADVLVRKSVWIIGGDGWAYDIDYGGLDHVLSQGRNVNIMVLDTEVYSNTGGQASKSTPRGAIAKFASGGKSGPKKDMALLAMTYGNVYVARIAMGANDVQTLRALREAEAYQGTSLVIAYSHCIAHGFNLGFGMDQQKAAVQSGHWPLMRYNPDLALEGKNPLQLDSKAPSTSVLDYMRGETRFLMVERQDPARFKRLAAAAQRRARQRWSVYQQLASIVVPSGEEGEQRGSHKWT
jgi:pyruvate-ferredoxin/flavodoxin oxidoreductase